MSFQLRVKEIKALEWVKIKAIADKLGYEKPEGKSWGESASEIATLELQLKKATPQVPKTERVETELGRQVKSNYKQKSVLYCGVCDAPLATDTMGNATCHARVGVTWE